MGYSPCLLLKNGEFVTLPNSSEIDINSRGRSAEFHFQVFSGVSWSLERIPGLAKIRHVTGQLTIVGKTLYFILVRNTDPRWFDLA